MYSKLIEKVWGKGRTSYQNFSEHEAPYISLYSTPQETFKKAYKLNLDKLHRLEDYAKTSIKYDSAGRKNLIKQIAEMRKALENSKKKYILAKEWNTWSLSLGWEEWEKQYIKAPKYVFTEYIEDCEYVTPTPWVKKWQILAIYLALWKCSAGNVKRNTKPTKQEQRQKRSLENMRRKKTR